MDRKKIKEKRKRGYFIDAAKNIIKNEGVDKLTVKKIAELAGFAPGTLYNHFEDLNDLLSYCIEDYWKECRDYVLNKIKSKSGAKERIISAGKAYCSYFMENAEIYHLIFIKDIKKVPKKRPEAVMILIEQLKKAIDEGLIKENELKVMENILGNSIHGLMLFYNKNRTDASKEEILKIFEEEVNYLIGRESDKFEKAF